MTVKTSFSVQRPSGKSSEVSALVLFLKIWCSPYLFFVSQWSFCGRKIKFWRVKVRPWRHPWASFKCACIRRPTGSGWILPWTVITQGKDWSNAYITMEGYLLLLKYYYWYRLPVDGPMKFWSQLKQGLDMVQRRSVQFHVLYLNAPVFYMYKNIQILCIWLLCGLSRTLSQFCTSLCFVHVQLLAVCRSVKCYTALGRYFVILPGQPW